MKTSSTRNVSVNLNPKRFGRNSGGITINYRVIKENDLFLTTNTHGDIPLDNKEGLGLYAKDMRFLSRMEMLINNKKPILLSSRADENYSATILLTNDHIGEGEEFPLWRESIELKRKRFIFEGMLYESAILTNYFPKPVEFRFTVIFEADFKDMFIVRGFDSGKVGLPRKPVYKPGQLTLAYDSTDEVARETRISWDSEEMNYEGDGYLHFQIKLAPQESKEIPFYIAPYHNGTGATRRPIAEAISLLQDSYRAWGEQSTLVKSDLPLFNELFNKGLQDFRVLLTDLGFGSFPVAGLPWYDVPFGRDSLTAALQIISVNPLIARGTLKTLANYQGTKVDEWRDEEPGKIMHEIRYGELANTNQVPFSPYYGTVDATPLFLLLLAEYYHWTEDIQLVQELMPHVELALNWIDEYGDRDKDTLVEYYKNSSKGIANQGWKDSSDSIVHENGDYAEAPIALVEVQGYVYQAKTKLAPILRLLGHLELASKLELEAQQLKDRFEAEFWMDDHQYYAIALDADKKQVRSVTSNPGHVLMSGLMDPTRAAQVAKRLVSPDMFSGYGIRTMSNQSAGYNPMSYHDGSVWPHDNSLSLLGLSSLGFHDEANTIIEGLLKSAEGFEYYRLPELFCGYDTAMGIPIPYPVACSPQAWAAGTPLVMAQVMVGVKPDAIHKCIQIHPSLPLGMNELSISNMAIGRGTLSLTVKRQMDGNLKIHICSNSTGFRIETGQFAVTSNI